VEDLLEVEASDLEQIESLKENAGAIIEAAKAEAAKRSDAGQHSVA
jgi:hypothetical protein